MLTIALMSAAALGVPIVALAIYGLIWRRHPPRRNNATVRLRGSVVGSGVVFERDAFGKLVTARRFAVDVGSGEPVRVDPGEAQLEARARPGRGADVRAGDRVAVDGLVADDHVEATRIVRAGWPRGGMLLGCLVIAGSTCAAIGVVKLRQSDGCPAGTTRTARRLPTVQEVRCVSADGVAQGPVEMRDYAGWLRQRGSYRDGLKHGRWITYHRREKVASIVQYRRGVKHGRWTRYSRSGKRTGVAEMRDGSGEWRGFHESGKLAERGHYARERKQGEWLFLRADGKKARRAHFDKGVLDGPSMRWHDSGALAERGSYKKGKRDGFWEHWRSDGTKKSAGTYRADKRHGDWTFFRRDGSKRRTGHFVRGVKHGRFRVLAKDGEPMIDGVYKNGNRVGLWTWWCKRCPACNMCEGDNKDKERVEKRYTP
ncbi:MAG: toxin-antitoxin system YwqK family antitoxin [Myxococcales bacterium]|nr:toxin-antitoxin system YwqK family antitoxin [Myxococcales bacterium]